MGVEQPREESVEPRAKSGEQEASLWYHADKGPGADIFIAETSTARLSRWDTESLFYQQVQGRTSRMTRSLMRKITSQGRLQLRQSAPQKGAGE